MANFQLNVFSCLILYHFQSVLCLTIKVAGQRL